MAREDGQFKPNDPRRAKGGRPKKPDWLKGKGEEALKKAYEIMMDDSNKPELVLQAARMLIEYDLGKPAQALDISADVSADATISTIEGMSLAKRKRALDAALKAYGEDKKHK